MKNTNLMTGAYRLGYELAIGIADPITDEQALREYAISMMGQTSEVVTEEDILNFMHGYRQSVVDQPAPPSSETWSDEETIAYLLAEEKWEKRVEDHEAMFYAMEQQENENRSQMDGGVQLWAFPRLTRTDEE